MNKNLFLRVCINILFFAGIFGSGTLVLDELKKGSICPTLINIPACYIIFLCFTILYILYILNKRDIYFYGVALFPISIALYGTVFQLIGTLECPKTGGGIPMCYISLAMFSSLCLLKYLINKK